MSESIGKAYKPWLIASAAVLVGSLLLLAIMGTVAFAGFANTATPLWVIILSVVAALGVALGFAGLFLLMLAAGLQSFRESRRVQIIPPQRDAGAGQR